MKNTFTDEIIQGMLPFLDNAQLKQLRQVLQSALTGYEIAKNEGDNAEQFCESNQSPCLNLFFQPKELRAARKIP